MKRQDLTEKLLDIKREKGWTWKHIHEEIGGLSPFLITYRGSIPTMPPTDPLIYRFYELISVYGTTFKELIQEEFGDGIMSAIDFNMDMAREANNKGDRVKLTMSGKFLPYKYYGNDDGTPDYGFKEG